MSLVFASLYHEYPAPRRISRKSRELEPSLEQIKSLATRSLNSDLKVEHLFMAEQCISLNNLSATHKCKDSLVFF